MRRVALVLGLLVVALAPAAAQPGDWGVRRDPFDRGLIARYKAILVREPHDPLALSALVSLYKRHRSIELLVREYEDARTHGETAAHAVVLARLARNANDKDRARELYARAVELDAADARSWTALGELRAAAGDKAGSRRAFAAASEHAKTPAHKQAALRALIAATRDAGDRDAMEAAYDALLQLRPRDGQLWADRGDAAVEHQAYDDAIASYAKAEELLRGDPERRLQTIASRALAYDRAGKPGEAVDEYTRAQNASPPGYYLRRELTLKIIDVFRRHHTLDAALDYLARTWPEKKRTGFQWATLADLHAELRQIDAMVDALHRAVKQAPRDTATQWKLIRHYDARKEGTIALTLLETAAKASPRDLSLNLELAQRLWATGFDEYDDEDQVYPDAFVAVWARSRMQGRPSESRRRALAIAKRLSASLPREAEAHRALAEVYARWGRIELALAETRKLVALEPSDDNRQMLGDALFAAGRKSEALTVWKKIATSGTPAALQRLGDIYLDHQLWEDAVDAFTAAMFGDEKNPMLWRGRAVALAELGRWSEARIDADHAVKLLGVVPYDKGHEIRFRLVQVIRDEAVQDALGDETAEPDAWLRTWDKAFFVATPADLQAGYLLAEYYRRRPDERLARVLERLHQLVPADHGVVTELIRTYRQLAELDKAIALGTWLAAADPTRAQDMRELVATIETDRELRAAATTQETRDDASYFTGTCNECRYVVRDPDGRAKLGTHLGIRVGLGDSLRGPAAGTLTFGTRLLLPLHDQLALTTRVDGVRRVAATETMERSVYAVGGSVGLAYPIVRLPQGSALLGAAYRTELRLGSERERAGYDRVGFAAEASLELVLDQIPTALGMRFEQSLSDGGANSTLLLEATFDLR